jgi:hypothetical protein
MIEMKSETKKEQMAFSLIARHTILMCPRELMADVREMISGYLDTAARSGMISLTNAREQLDAVDMCIENGQRLADEIAKKG